MNNRSYSEMAKLKTFEERFNYLKLDGIVGLETFGYDRYLNQEFFHSKEWKSVRNRIIIRDEGCDLGISDREVHGCIHVHHINPIRVDDLVHSNLDILLDPDNLITVSSDTHRAIHYGDECLFIADLIVRTKDDTKLW